MSNFLKDCSKILTKRPRIYTKKKPIKLNEYYNKPIIPLPDDCIDMYYRGLKRNPKKRKFSLTDTPEIPRSMNIEMNEEEEFFQGIPDGGDLAFFNEKEEDEFSESEFLTPLKRMSDTKSIKREVEVEFLPNAFEDHLFELDEGLEFELDKKKKDEYILGDGWKFYEFLKRKNEKKMSFEKDVKPKNRDIAVTGLWNTLSLASRGKISLEQEDPYGEILLTI